MEISNHLLHPARQVPSPNCSDRLDTGDVDLLVIHNISLPPGEFGTGCIDQLFCNNLDAKAHPYFESISHLRVSSHLLIDRMGELTQYVPFNRKAWHAGDSVYAGRENCNEYSIGIELEGTDDRPFTDMQYSALVATCVALFRAYKNLKAGRIVGHSDIAPGRKTDPGPCFDWSRFRSQLINELEAIPR